MVFHASYHSALEKLKQPGCQEFKASMGSVCALE